MTTIRLLTSLLIAALLLPMAEAADIAGFGRIQPAGGIVSVSAPSTDTISEILVQEGQQVSSGGVLAILSSRAERQLQLEEARLALEQAELERSSGMQMEQEKHQNIKAGLGSARERLANLYANQAESYVSPEYIADREDDIAEFEQQLKLSSMGVEKLRRSMDLAVTRAQKQVAIAAAALENAEVRSPLTGRVLKVLGRPGEHVGPVLFMIGDAATMFVLTEVYESDVLRVKSGQKASISSAALPQPLAGTVKSVGTMIYKSSLDSLDSKAQTGSRVVEVLIQLDANTYAAQLINLQVDVVIHE